MGLGPADFQAPPPSPSLLTLTLTQTKARRFPPAAVLRRGGSGEPERDELLSILAGVEEWMRTAETRWQLSEAG